VEKHTGSASAWHRKLEESLLLRQRGRIPQAPQGPLGACLGQVKSVPPLKMDRGMHDRREPRDLFWVHCQAIGAPWVEGRFLDDTSVKSLLVVSWEWSMMRYISCLFRLPTSITRPASTRCGVCFWSCSDAALCTVLRGSIRRSA